MINFCEENKRDFFVGFLDFEKAFDFVNSAQLVKDMTTKGCGSQYVKVVANMYTDERLW